MISRELRASRSNPCRVCGRGNQRCLNYADGGCLCMVAELPGSKSVDCGSVGIGFYYPPAGNNVIPIQRQQLRPKQQEIPLNIAPLEKRDNVYRSLLQQLPLSDKHREHLMGPSRRLTENILDSFGTLPSDYSLRRDVVKAITVTTNVEGVPGFYKDREGQWSLAGSPGILIPYRTPSGLIQGFQVRCDDPSRGKYIWLSSANYTGGTSPGTHTHYILLDQSQEVWICEGGLKATVASFHTGKSFIGLPGCHIGDLQTILSMLKRTCKFVLAPDSDYRTNESVHKAWQKNLQIMQAAKLEVEIAEWNPEQGKGIDDFVLHIKGDSLYDNLRDTHMP